MCHPNTQKGGGEGGGRARTLGRGGFHGGRPVCSPPVLRRRLPRPRALAVAARAVTAPPCLLALLLDADAVHLRVIRTEAAAEIPLRLDSFHVRFVSRDQNRGSG
jgi:hypothetical protein